MDPLSELLPSILSEYKKLQDITQAPILVDTLRQLFPGRGYADRIILERFFFDSRYVIAKVEFYKGNMGVYAGSGNYARIQYSHELNLCWSRFAVLKEMYHCLLDAEPLNRVADIDGLMTLGQMLVSDAFATVKDYPPFHTEEWAEILALETLFPIELRSHHKADFDRGLISQYQLALRYRIPERYVSIAMMQGYYEFVYSRRVDSLVAI